MKGLKIFSLAFFSYLTLALYSNYFDKNLRNLIYAKGFSSSMLLMGTVFSLLFFSFMALGYIKPLKLNDRILALSILLLSLFELPWAPIAAAVLVATYLFRLKPSEFHAKISLLSAFVTLLTLYSVGGVPLLNPTLRYRFVGFLVMAAFFGLVAIIYLKTSIKVKTLLLILLEVLLFLGTFRSLMILIFMGYLFDLYFEGVLRLDVRLSLSLLTVAASILYLSHGLEHLMVRIGFTFLVFHNIVRLSLPLGLFHGSLIMSDNPRHLVGELFGAKTNYTYFLFGQPIADFGVLGVAEAYLFGVFLRCAEENPKTSALVLSLLIYTIETGMDAFTLLLILSALLFRNIE
ncbi:hypothetical protein [Thermococcus sp.]